MDSLYFLIPVSIIFIGLIVAIFLWAVRSGQFDDLEGPGHSILHEDETLDSDDKRAEKDEKNAD